MKKILLVVLVLILATLCFASCDVGDKYDKLNKMANTFYAQVTIDVTVQKADEDSKLVSKITCLSVTESTKQVAYVLQEYANFNVDGDTITAPNTQIVTKSGTVSYANGQVESVTGDQVDYDFSKLGNKLFMSFGAFSLSNDKTENGVFTADITNQWIFFGREIPGATNMKVAVNVETYKSITITYTANGSDVTIVYTLA